MSDTAVAAAGRRAAASYLRELLQRPGRYRRLWAQHVVRSRPGEITQLAVAEVLAQHLWNYPRAAGDADVLPHQLKDTVWRALSGRLLSRSTLSLFIDAFGFSETEADRLWRLWEGSGTISVLSGARAVAPATAEELRAALGPHRHQTLSLHDHVYVGVDGRVARSRTIQVLEAMADGVDRVPFLYDTNALTVEAGQGCRGLTGRLYRAGGGIYATHLGLAKTLAVGETTTLEYWTTYHYPGDPDDPGEREYRRAVMRGLENLDLRVEFHSQCLPDHLWWATWDGVEGEILSQEEVALDSQHSAHRYLRFIEKAVAGFHWSWEPGRKTR